MTSWHEHPKVWDYIAAGIVAMGVTYEIVKGFLAH